ncbi:MAG: hypothetical protein LW849_07735 [Burkholderiales bacterium]|jgi:hypothetical protein|nr:hypothetical protein [Burkholderiales bacterium]
MNTSASPRLQQGLVLPIVLIMMVILTSLVITQVRRSTIDQQLAVNSRGYSLAESALQSVLRKCERDLLRQGDAPEPAAGNPAWRDAAQWANNMLNLDSDVKVDYPGIQQNYGCLLEDASAELQPPMTNEDFSPEQQDRGWRKYRVTARVTLVSGQQLHLQSELRYDRNSINTNN